MSQRTDQRLAIAILLATAVAAWTIGWAVTQRVEARTAERLDKLMAAAGLDWVSIAVDGTQVTLRGEAPDEWAALAAHESVGQASIWAVTEDHMTIAAPQTQPAPQVPVEPVVTIWRDDRSLSITGQVPGGETRHGLTDMLADAADGIAIEDFASETGQPPPPQWPLLTEASAAMAASLEHGSVSLRPGRVMVEGLPAGLIAQERIERSARLLRKAGIAVHVDMVQAPAAAATPYRFTAKLEGDRATVLLCTAPDDEAGEAIATLASTLLDAPYAACRIDPDAPAPGWIAAVHSGLIALSALGAGRFELEATEARLIPAPETLGPAFETAAARLAADLPATYRLVAAPDMENELPLSEEAAPWLRARRSADRVWLMGEAPDEATLEAVTAYADAVFGATPVDSVMTATDTALPEGWRAAALAALDALAPLQRGESVVGDGEVRIWGSALQPGDARDTQQALAGLDTRGWRGTSRITIDVPALVDSMALGPQRCVAALKRTVEAEPILFDPSEASIDVASRGVLDALAATLRRCRAITVEIGGHTDSQGSLDYNRRLSAARAAEVRVALLERGAGKVRLTTHGYGPSQPIADNATEAGRALNRRIAFTVVEEQPASPEPTASSPGALTLTGTPPPLIVPVPRP
jgi:OOP family OmpA-OmpF porin